MSNIHCSQFYLSNYSYFLFYSGVDKFVFVGKNPHKTVKTYIIISNYHETIIMD